MFILFLETKRLGVCTLMCFSILIPFLFFGVFHFSSLLSHRLAAGGVACRWYRDCQAGGNARDDMLEPLLHHPLR